MNLILFPAPTRITFNKNKPLVLATGAESGKGLSAYLQNSLSLFTPTFHSQGKDMKIYKKYWYANEMVLTIFSIHAFIYRPVKLGFTEQINHLPFIFKTCIQSVTSFYLSRCWQTELPWFCLNYSVRIVSFNYSHTLCSVVTEVYFLPIYQFPKYSFGIADSTSYVLLFILLSWSLKSYRALQWCCKVSSLSQSLPPNVARGTILLDYSASVKAWAFKNLCMLSSPLLKVNYLKWRQEK